MSCTPKVDRRTDNGGDNDEEEENRSIDSTILTFAIVITIVNAKFAKKILRGLE